MSKNVAARPTGIEAALLMRQVIASFLFSVKNKKIELTSGNIAIRVGALRIIKGVERSEASSTAAKRPRTNSR